MFAVCPALPGYAKHTDNDSDVLSVDVSFTG